MFGVILLPNFALQAALRHRSNHAQEPVAILTDEAAPKPVVWQVNRLSQEAFLVIEGRVQIAEGTIHIKAEQIEGPRNLGTTAHAASHDFH